MPEFVRYKNGARLNCDFRPLPGSFRSISNAVLRLIALLVHRGTLNLTSIDVLSIPKCCLRIGNMGVQSSTNCLGHSAWRDKYRIYTANWCVSLERATKSCQDVINSSYARWCCNAAVLALRRQDAYIDISYKTIRSILVFVWSYSSLMG